MTDSWSATESRLLEPYLRADNLLHGIKFRCRPSDAYEELSVHWFDRGSVPQDFLPAFLIDTDWTLVAEAVDIPLESLAATIVVRDRARKRWRPFGSWPLAGMPEEIYLELSPAEFALAYRMEFAFMVTPSKLLERRQGRAYRRDQPVAVRAFQTNLRRDGSRFNISTMPESWFEEHGYSRDTVWALDWESRDPYMEPVAVLTVVMNERYQQAIQLQLAGDGGKVLAAQLATEILLEAALVALDGAEEFETEPSTLLGSVLSAVGVTTSEQFDTLKDRVSEDAGRTTISSFLRGRLQASIGLGRAALTASRRPQ